MRLGWLLVICACSGAGKLEPIVAKPDPVVPLVIDATPVAVEAEVDANPDTPFGDAAKRDAELADRLLPFVDAFTNSEPVFATDGKRIVFVSNRDGVPQVYVAGEGPATRLATSNERMIGPLPAGNDVVFGSDVGFDEQFSIFRVGLDGKNLIELTPKVKLARTQPLIAERRPDTLYFTARKMGESRGTIYSTSSRSVTEPKAIYSEDGAILIDVSADGKVGLIHKAPARLENYVVRLDLETGKPGWQFPTDRQVIIFWAKLAHDGKRVLVATDDGTDQASLIALDLATGKEVARHPFTPSHAQINGMAEAKAGRVIAVMLTVGNGRELRLLDARTLAEKTVPALPPGSGRLGGVSPDGKQVLVSWSAPSAPDEIYVVDTMTGKAEPRREARPTLVGAPEIEVVTDEITSFDGSKVATHVYLPKGEAGKKHPVIVEFHGGPAFVSLIRWDPFNAFFVSLGYAVVEPNIRGSTGYGRNFEAADDGPKRLDSFKDIEAVRAWIGNQPWADNDRVVAFGGSYGGYLTLLALTRWPKQWRAGLAMAAPSDMITNIATTAGNLKRFLIREVGDPEKDAAFLKSISPLHLVDQIVAPLFIYQGANDPRVPKSEADQMVRALRQRKIPVEYMVAETEGHSRSRRETVLAMYPRMARFLEAALR